MAIRLRSFGFLVFILGILTPTAHGEDISATWIQKQSVQWFPDGPGPRGWSRLFYDTRSQRIALYGGSAGAGFKSDVWHYDTHNDIWAGIEVPTLDCPGYLGPNGGPDGRDAHSTEYDPFNHLYWAVAGSGYKCMGSHGEVLPVRTAGNGTTATAIVDTSLPATETNFYKDWLVTVGSKMSYVTGYNAGTKTLTLSTAISGLGAGSSYKIQFFTDGQTWYYSPTTRQWRSMEGPYWGAIRPSPVVNPPDRYAPGFAYSRKDNAIVFFGGSKNGNGSNDTWTLDLATKTWSQKTLDSATGFPLKLQELSNSFAYDEANDVFILFGGRCADSRCPQYGKPSGDTWAYKLSTNTWTKMSPAVSPPARIDSTLYYDRNSGLTVLFGGATVDIFNQFPTSANLLNDLWVYRYSTNTWAQIPTANAPAARYLHMMAFDQIEGKAVLYGGNRPTGSAEVWTLEITDPQANPLPVPMIDATLSDGSNAFSFSAARSFDRSGTLASYLWNFGDGNTGSGVATSHTYSNAGVYPVSLTVTDNSGGSATAWYRADTSGGGGGSSNLPPVAVATASPTSGTTSTVFSFSAAGSSDPDGVIASYSWSFGDGAVASGSSVAHQFTSSGSYTVTLTVLDNLGASAITSMVVTVSTSMPLPAISFQRQISGVVQNGVVTQVLADGVPVPFTASGSSFTATLTSTYSRTVNLSVHATGAGGSTNQAVTVTVP